MIQLEQNQVQPGDQYARYQGRVVEILQVFGSTDGSQISYYQIRDGQSIDQVFAHQLTRHVITPVEPSLVETQVPTEPKFSLVFVNEVTDPATISALPTIGTTGAKKIIERKPNGGYKNFDQFKQINQDLARTDWEVIESLIRF